MRTVFRSAAAALLFTLFAGAEPLLGDEGKDRRAQTGARLFRALLAADNDLTKKTLDGKLLVLFLYVDDKERATSLANRFGGEGKDRGVIKELPLMTEVVHVSALAKYTSRPPAGVFLAQEPSPGDLANVIRFGIERRVIVYSPFEGHVERGVLAGLAVEAQVRPYVNLTTLAASNISLKSFFLKVTKVHR